MKRTPLKRGQPMKRTAMKQKPRKKRIGEDTEYEDFIRSCPCLICHLDSYLSSEVNEYSITTLSQQQKTHTQCAHVGVRGLNQKCPSRECVPLCADHHLDGKDAHHGPIGRQFWEHHGVTLEAALLICQKLYLGMSK